LYSAWLSLAVSCDPQTSQNRAPSRGSAPHARQSIATVKEYGFWRRLVGLLTVRLVLET
jgi:hypothetical protein